MRVMVMGLLILSMVGCGGPRYVMDQEAQRCRDSRNGQWVKTGLCK